MICEITNYVKGTPPQYEELKDSCFNMIFKLSVVRMQFLEDFSYF